ncbi:MAG: PfkB family carbohydrate kinase [Acidimicrobiia bacterium]|nr:PfkB family carbohydrate kinase [Acidimicrobiia bacterium]
MTSVTCVGLAVADYVFGVDETPGAPGKHFARSYTEVGGGPAANAAVTVASLGGTARYIGHVGADGVGERIVADLAALGVDVSRVRVTVDRQSPVSAVLVDAEGERTIVNFTDPGLYDDVDPVTVDDVGDADAVLADVRWPAGAEWALAAAADRRIPGLLDYDRSPDDVSALLDAASHVAFGAEALAALSGTDDPSEGLRRVRSDTPAWLAVTGGADGVWWLEEGEVRHLPAFDVDVVDTLGAGDVFHGALALALGEGREPAGAVRFASAAAAVKCTRFGGRSGIPDRAEVDGLLRERSNGGDGVRERDDGGRS